MSHNWAWPPGWRRLRQATLDRYGHACYRCGAYATTIDHAIPVALGGTHDLSNLRPACASCNSSTGASMGNRLRPWQPLTAAQRHAIAAKAGRQAPPETWRQSRRW